MGYERFPDPEGASDEGIVAIGGDLEPATLIEAYSRGIFPWPVRGMPLPWFCPAERAILRFSDLHVSRSLARARRKRSLRYTIDRCFDDVVSECAKRPRAEGTWITSAMKHAYQRLHAVGHAHSIEVWRDEQLVGGLYGVSVLGTFAGESMFHREPDASKLALLYLTEHLAARGLDWIDIQMLTPHLEAMGAVAIPRTEFLALLRATQDPKRRLFG